MFDFQYLQETCARIPLSYYTKTSKYKMQADQNAPTSYIDFKTNQITISYNNVNDALQNLKRTPDPEEFESLVRGLVYHETMHALITPPKLMEWASNAGVQYMNHTVCNCLEDARIEDIGAGYFLKTNFIKNKKLMLTPPSRKDMISNFDAFVFGVARCDMAPDLFNKYIRTFIDNTKDHAGDFYTVRVEMNSCALNLYKEWEQLQQQQNQNESENGAPQNNENNNEPNQSNGGANQQQNNEPKQADPDDQNQNQNESGAGSIESNETNEPELSNEEREKVASILGDALNEKEKENALSKQRVRGGRFDRTVLDNSFIPADLNLKNKLIKLIARGGGFGHAKRYVGGGYSGQFNTNEYIRDLQRRDQQYTWFNDTMRHTSNAQNNKIKKLNIILDNSGSFQYNDKTASQILKTLCDIEKMTAFQFRLFILDNEFEEVLKEHRTSCSKTDQCGTMSILKQDLTGTFADIVKERTIFLTDGGMHDFCHTARKYYSAFPEKIHANLHAIDKKHVVIISNNENAGLFKKAKIHDAQIIFTDNYTGELKENIIRAFDALYK